MAISRVCWRYLVAVQDLHQSFSGHKKRWRDFDSAVWSRRWCREDISTQVSPTVLVQQVNCSFCCCEITQHLMILSITHTQGITCFTRRQVFLVTSLAGEVSCPASDSKWHYKLTYTNLLHSPLVMFLLHSSYYVLWNRIQSIVDFPSPSFSDNPLLSPRLLHFQPVMFPYLSHQSPCTTHSEATGIQHNPSVSKSLFPWHRPTPSPSSSDNPLLSLHLLHSQPVIHVVKDISLLSVDENHHTRHHLFCKLDWHHLSLVPPLTSEVSYPASDSKWQYQLPYINLLYSDSLLVAFALLYSLLCHTQWIVNFASPYPSGDPLRETRPQNLLRVCHCDESLLFDLACIDPTYLLIIFPWLAGQDDIPDLIWFDDEMPPLGETLADCGSSRRGMVSEQ